MNELEFRQWLSNSDVPKKVQSDIVSRLKRLERINGYFDLDEEYEKDNCDIDTLVGLKREIGNAIKAVEKPKHRELLERRYLCCKSWEQIAVDMCYDIRRVYQVHGEALAMITPP